MICKQCGHERDPNRKNCSTCNKIYQRKWYAENKELHKSRVKKNKKDKKDFLYTEVYKYLASHPCVDCGETDPVVLHFDHREQNQKEFSVSYMLGATMPLEKIMSEITKCDVRCANCHMRRTAKQLGWRKQFIGDGW